jgi:hypothetical protein
MGHHEEYLQRKDITPWRILELSIENGEPLFSVDYKDPYIDDIDDNYFDESEDESNGDHEFDDDA